METQNNFKTLTCEQVYNIWISEPELIRILDLRPRLEFEQRHIPGAHHVPPESLFTELQSLNGRLAIIVTEHKNQEALLSTFKDHNEFIFMQDCQRWFETNKPLTGTAVRLKNPSPQDWSKSMATDVIFYQLFESESSTYTYLIADKTSKEAALIDPVLTTVDRDLKLVQELGLRLMYVLDTHVHADHITGAGEIRKRTQAKTGVSLEAGVSCVDIPLEDGQELTLGNKKIKVLATPGHTNTCLSFYFEGMVFTGDTLLIRGTGRTDFQQGSSERLYESVYNKIFTLPGDTQVYPGHDYRGQTHSTIELEKRYNPRLGGGKTKDDFNKIMAELKLDNPKKIHEAVPANLACGTQTKTSSLHAQIVDGISEVSCEELLKHLGKVRIIDVRRPEEFNNELGHVPTSELITLGSELTNFLEKGDRSEEIVFTCRSGGRSGQATAESIRLGYKKTFNLAGGMIRWNELKQVIERI